MYWPVMTDYQEAMQNPKLCFTDNELRDGIIDLDHLGLPRPISGNFACVYGLTYKTSKWAVRCFLKNNPDQEKRYQCIHDFLGKFHSPYFVPFRYIREGIRVKGIRYPILKMEWVNGETLSTYIENNLKKPGVIQSLSQKFFALARDLEERSIAHGDLQHGNIIIVGGEIKLVDYDGMYVPGLDGMISNEIGHPNYQHPMRSEKDFGPYIDRFSEWIIYLSLKALAVNPSLWINLKGGDENLIFRKADFNSPFSTDSFRLLETQKNGELKNIAYFLREVINCGDLREVPKLDNLSISNIQKISSPVSGIVNLQANPRNPLWVFDHIEFKTVEFSGNLVIERLSLGILAAALLLTLVLFVLRGFSAQLFLFFFGSELLLNVAFFYWRYNRRDEVKEKQKILSRSTSIRNEFVGLDSLIEKFKMNITEIANEEKEKVTSLNQKGKFLAQREVNEVSDVDLDLRKHLHHLDNQMQKLNDEEKNEWGNALQSLQEKFMDNNLSNFRLDNASIHGIGDEIKRRLMQAGVFTAADLLDYHLGVSTWQQRDREIAYLSIKGKGVTHVEGIGPAKAKLLITWRKNLEQQYKRSVPQAIPSEISAQITEKYQGMRASLNREIINARYEAEQKKNRINTRFQSDIERNRNEIRKLTQSFAAKRTEQEEKIKHQYKEKDKLNWEQASLEKRISEYKNINFYIFLRRITQI